MRLEFPPLRCMYSFSLELISLFYYDPYYDLPAPPRPSTHLYKSPSRLLALATNVSSPLRPSRLDLLSSWLRVFLFSRPPASSRLATLSRTMNLIPSFLLRRPFLVGRTSEASSVLFRYFLPPFVSSLSHPSLSCPSLFSLSVSPSRPSPPPPNYLPLHSSLSSVASEPKSSRSTLDPFSVRPSSQPTRSLNNDDLCSPLPY